MFVDICGRKEFPTQKILNDADKYNFTDMSCNNIPLEILEL
jgi:hypothetical protein